MRRNGKTEHSGNAGSPHEGRARVSGCDEGGGARNQDGKASQAGIGHAPAEVRNQDL